MEFLSAAHSGNHQVLKQLLEMRRDLVHMRDSNGFTALSLAAEKGHREAARVLLDAGAEIDTQTSTGNTALMWASARGHTDVVIMLLSRQADTWVANENGDMALMWAASQGHLDITQLVLIHMRKQMQGKKEKEKPSTRDGQGWVTFGDPLRMVTKKGMNVFHFAAAGGMAHMLKFFMNDEDVTREELVNSVDRQANSPLHHAALHGRAAAVAVLLENDADVTLTNRKGQTALALARQENDETTVKLLQERWDALAAERTAVAAALLAELEADSSAAGEGQSGGSAKKDKKRKKKKEKRKQQKQLEQQQQKEQQQADAGRSEDGSADAAATPAGTATAAATPDMPSSGSAETKPARTKASTAAGARKTNTSSAADLAASTETQGKGAGRGASSLAQPADTKVTPLQVGTLLEEVGDEWTTVAKKAAKTGAAADAQSRADRNNRGGGRKKEATSPEASKAKKNGHRVATSAAADGGGGGGGAGPAAAGGGGAGPAAGKTSTHTNPTRNGKKPTPAATPNEPIAPTETQWQEVVKADQAEPDDDDDDGTELQFGAPPPADDGYGGDDETETIEKDAAAMSREELEEAYARERARATSLQGELESLNANWELWSTQLQKSRQLDWARLESLDLQVPHILGLELGALSAAQLDYLVVVHEEIIRHITEQKLVHAKRQREAILQTHQ
eukprot:SAG22_NODE_30_length_28348_cov_12.488584_11_plen_682_part_00